MKENSRACSLPSAQVQVGDNAHMGWEALRCCLGPGEACRVAKDQKVSGSGRQSVRLARPIDLAVAHHSDALGFFPPSSPL